MNASVTIPSLNGADGSGPADFPQLAHLVPLDRPDSVYRASNPSTPLLQGRSEIGRYLSRCAIGLALSAKMLARRLARSPRTVENWLQGRRTINADDLLQLHRAYPLCLAEWNRLVNASAPDTRQLELSFDTECAGRA